jgi:hypothetical protein
MILSCKAFRDVCELCAGSDGIVSADVTDDGRGDDHDDP